MANYVTYDGTIQDMPKMNCAKATPGDTSTIMVRRGYANTAKQTLNNADIAHVMPVYVGEVILKVWTRVITAESTANAELEIGIDGGKEFLANVPVAAANAVAISDDIGYHVGSNADITVTPNNGVAVDTGVVEICALVTKSFTENQ
jgi:hypothetical protein